jgi:hypothetical protein
MKTKNSLTACGAATLAALVVLLVFEGCEKDTNAGALTVSPGDVTLSGSSNCVTLSVTVDTNATDRPFSGTGLEWTVSDPSLGNILLTSGNQAYYCRTAQAGDNLLVVRDAYGAEGWVTIHQR